MGRAVTLVLTHPFDPTADYVVSELNRRGAPVFRCDPGEFPRRLSVTARLDGTGTNWAGSLRLPERQVLAARIDAGSDSATVDWRTDYEALTYTPLADIPSRVRAGVSALMGRLGLRLGALDFIVTPDDRWVFLEINPNGQWAWIEDATGLPIAASITDALTRGSG